MGRLAGASEEQAGDHDDDARGDAGVGQVEGRPVLEGDEVGHLPAVAAEESLGQVAQAHRRAPVRPPTARGTVRTRQTTTAKTTTPTQSSTETTAARPLKRLKAKPELKVRASPKGPQTWRTSWMWCTASDVVTRSATTTTAAMANASTRIRVSDATSPPLLQATQSRA